jgi:hypothetical protein
MSSLSSPSFPRFPPELLLDIFSQADESSLASLCLANTTFLELASPFLYTNVAFEILPSPETISTRPPRLAKLLSQITLDAVRSLSVSLYRPSRQDQRGPLKSAVLACSAASNAIARGRGPCEAEKAAIAKPAIDACLATTAALPSPPHLPNVRHLQIDIPYGDHDVFNQDDGYAGCLSFLPISPLLVSLNPTSLVIRRTILNPDPIKKAEANIPNPDWDSYSTQIPTWFAATSNWTSLQSVTLVGCSLYDYMTIGPTACFLSSWTYGSLQIIYDVRRTTSLAKLIDHDYRWPYDLVDEETLEIPSTMGGEPKVFIRTGSEEMYKLVDERLREFGTSEKGTRYRDRVVVTLEQQGGRGT